MKKIAAIFLICLIALYSLLSCGLEQDAYIDFIEQGDYMDITRATVRLPSISKAGYSTFFDNFIIFYRIYVSNDLREGKIDNDDLRRAINQTLDNDFQMLWSYTDITSTTVSTANLENTFLSRKYFKLELKEADITNVLGSGVTDRDGTRFPDSRNKTLEIVFSTLNSENPTLSLDGGTAYTLQRANKAPGLEFYPQPDDADLFRTFLNHPKLCDTANATNTQINPDVVAVSTSPDLRRYTYVSMYIAAVGRNGELPPAIIYSQPTFIGIFRLAEWS